MKNKKYTIKLGFEELCLIERALESYGRIGMLQFDYLIWNHSLYHQISELDIRKEFDEKCKELKMLFDYEPNCYPGIYNTEFVGDDCRIAMHIYQILRHQRYLDRIASGEQTENHYTVDEYPADICQIADMELPDFNILNN